VGVTASVAGLATLALTLIATDPLGARGAGSAGGGAAGQGGDATTAAPAVVPERVEPGWRVALRPGSTVDLDTGVVVGRADTLSLGADLVYDAGYRLVAAGGDPAEGSGDARVAATRRSRGWTSACGRSGRAAGGEPVDARRLRAGSALCVRTTAGAFMLLVADRGIQPSDPVLRLTLRRIN